MCKTLNKTVLNGNNVPVDTDVYTPVLKEQPRDKTVLNGNNVPVDTPVLKEQPREQPKLINKQSYLLHKISFTRERDPSFSLTSRGCLICRLNFSNENLFQDHIKAHGDDNTIPLMDKTM